MKYLYAIEFADGSVKIGMTCKPRTRATQLSRQFGVAVSRAHTAPMGETCFYQAECAALRTANRMAERSEFNTELFYGLKFGAAATVVTQMARRKFKQPQPLRIRRRNGSHAISPEVPAQEAAA